ncbi:MAG TPA: antibiotic biosynthesis monooxygenase [Paracoccaceae bacterium]|nr:antibiotic biosynthesis monooxygenase [Paracoccaceae bacterium]
MFIAMNRFRVLPEACEAFEETWRCRRSYLDEAPGFVAFHLLRGPEAEDHRLYASHSVWQDRAAFEAWTRSEAFRKAHQQARMPEGVLRGHPKLQTFEAVLES